MDGKGGGTSFKRCETVCLKIWDISWTNVLPGPDINGCCNCSARYSVASAGRIQFGESLIVASPYIVLYYFSSCEVADL